jgi:hypothetical protein
MNLVTTRQLPATALVDWLVSKAHSYRGEDRFNAVEAVISEWVYRCGKRQIWPRSSKRDGTEQPFFAYEDVNMALGNVGLGDEWKNAWLPIAIEGRKRRDIEIGWVWWWVMQPKESDLQTHNMTLLSASVEEWFFNMSDIGAIYTFSEMELNELEPACMRMKRLVVSAMRGLDPAAYVESVDFNLIGRMTFLDAALIELAPDAMLDKLTTKFENISTESSEAYKEKLIEVIGGLVKKVKESTLEKIMDRLESNEEYANSIGLENWLANIKQIKERIEPRWQYSQLRRSFGSDKHQRKRVL